jgi:flavodoxin/Pyruvate/2-oxoacid:ferredoxin oxidoreductase delta subunit
MKAVILYYSSTGNTQLACQYLAQRITNVEFDLRNITERNDVDLTDYDVVGFATSTQHMGVPYLFENFIKRLSSQQNKPAFLLNTYGAMSGRTLKNLANMVITGGFNVIAGHSLLTPENYPPFILKGWANEDAPNDEEIEKFQQFITELEQRMKTIESGRPVAPAKIKIGVFNSLMRPASSAKSRKKMGELFVDESVCTECGTCADGCPYGAVALNPKPLFDTDHCHGCWTCFNHCPEKAIYTQKIRGEGHYPQPLPQFIAKMEVQ